MRTWIGGAAVIVAACGGGGGSDDGSDAGTTGTGGIDEEGIGEVGGPKLDIGGGGDTAGDEQSGDDGCEKVDFLFVIDSSNSMETNQAELIASFPEFVATIQSTLESVDSYHVGVVTSDAYEFNEDGCTDMGALVTQTGGKDSGMETCSPFATPARFLTEADDLPSAFACIGQVGTDGANDEAMLAGALGAISPALNEAGACNDGFLRDDALLVMVLITDEDDPGTCIDGNQSCEGSPGDPMEWHDEVVDRKGGHPENVVVLSLTRGSPGNACDEAQGTEKDGERVMAFAQLFGATGSVGDICADSFGPFFSAAVGQIESACGGFIEPQG